MKTNTTISTRKTSGMTLIEITVVILVLLSLLSILYVGVRAWKQGSDRAGCIMNIREIQQEVRSWQNTNGHKPGDGIPIPWAAIKDKLRHGLKCPAGGEYTFAKTVPDVGELACTCEHAKGDLRHEPISHEDW